MEFYRKRALYVFACFIILIYSNIVWAETECEACHSGEEAERWGLKDVYAGIYKYRFRHNNVNRECRRCHIIEEFQIKAKGELYFPGNIKEGIFFLTGLSLDKEYEVELTFKTPRYGVLQKKVLKLKPSRIAVEKGDGAPPVVKTVRFLGIKEGIIPEGVLYFETDRPAVSVVEYWSDERYKERLRNFKVFIKKHRVRLSAIRRDKKYRYRIMVMDVFGNRSISEGVLFTQGVLTSYGMEVSGEKKEWMDPAIKVFRPASSADLCLYMKAPKPVMVSVSMREIVGSSKHGYGLRDARYTTIYVCTQCHRAGISHPVGVRSTRADIEVPEDLPTIEGGVITCVTCHYPHGGDSPYFARFDFDEICNRCHKGLQ